MVPNRKPTGTQLSDEQHLSGPFNFAAAPDAGGRFVGDYEGLTAVGSRFHPFFAITKLPAQLPREPDRHLHGRGDTDHAHAHIKRHGDPRPAPGDRRGGGDTATPGTDSMTVATSAPTVSADSGSVSRMKRLLLAAASMYLLFAVIGRFVESMGAVTCRCRPDCWCKTPVLSIFR